jgi:hypothetical protein
MEQQDDTLLQLVTEIRDVQVANLEVQRKLCELVNAQHEELMRMRARNNEILERGKVLQDRNMETLVAQRRFLLYWLPALALFLAAILAWRWLA